MAPNTPQRDVLVHPWGRRPIRIHLVPCVGAEPLLFTASETLIAACGGRQIKRLDEEADLVVLTNSREGRLCVEDWVMRVLQQRSKEELPILRGDWLVTSTQGLKPVVQDTSRYTVLIGDVQVAGSIEIKDEPDDDVIFVETPVARTPPASPALNETIPALPASNSEMHRSIPAPPVPHTAPRPQSRPPQAPATPAAAPVRSSPVTSQDVRPLVNPRPEPSQSEPSPAANLRPPPSTTIPTSGFATQAVNRSSPSFAGLAARMKGKTPPSKEPANLPNASPGPGTGSLIPATTPTGHSSRAGSPPLNTRSMPPTKRPITYSGKSLPPSARYSHTPLKPQTILKPSGSGEAISEPRVQKRVLIAEDPVDTGSPRAPPFSSSFSRQRSSEGGTSPVDRLAKTTAENGPTWSSRQRTKALPPPTAYKPSVAFRGDERDAHLVLCEVLARWDPSVNIREMIEQIARDRGDMGVDVLFKVYREHRSHIQTHVPARLPALPF